MRPFLVPFQLLLLFPFFSTCTTFLSLFSPFLVFFFRVVLSPPFFFSFRNEGYHFYPSFDPSCELSGQPYFFWFPPSLKGSLCLPHSPFYWILVHGKRRPGTRRCTFFFPCSVFSPSFLLPEQSGFARPSAPPPHPSYRRLSPVLFAPSSSLPRGLTPAVTSNPY